MFIRSVRRWRPPYKFLIASTAITKYSEIWILWNYRTNRKFEIADSALLSMLMINEQMHLLSCTAPTPSSSLKWKYSLQLCMDFMCYIKLTHLSLVSHKRDTCKQYRPRSDAAESGAWSGSTLFALSTGTSINTAIIDISQITYYWK